MDRKVTHHGQFGGEINTRPYHYCIEDLQELKNFIQTMRDAGSYLMWNEGFDAHLYIKDMDLNVIKRLFALSPTTPLIQSNEYLTLPSGGNKISRTQSTLGCCKTSS